MSVRFEPNPNFLIELAAQPGNQRIKREVAKAIVAYAKAVAPKGTDAYERSLRWYSTPERTVAVSTDMAAHLVEFGSVFNQPYSPLRLASRAVATRFVAFPKV